MPQTFPPQGFRHPSCCQLLAAASWAADRLHSQAMLEAGEGLLTLERKAGADGEPDVEVST